MSGGSAPSPASYDPNVQGGGSIGKMPAGQFWLCGWLPVLDGPRFTPLAAICSFDKPVLHDAWLLPRLTSPIGNIPIISALLDMIKGGGGIENWASDLVPAEIRQIMQQHEIYGEEASAGRSMMASFASQNIARSLASMDDGHSI